MLTFIAEEFNKYLSYVRNLGFEDTPDYDYLRDLFTQALKSTGEVEDGEYDWMKLNNGKGWEGSKQHSSQALQNHHVSAKDPHGTNRVSKTAIPPGRLEQELPKPGATRAPGQAQRTRTRDQHQYQGAGTYAKRSSAAADLAPPEGSTAAQFANSNANLPSQSRLSGQQQGMSATRPTQTQPAQQEPKQGFMAKLAKALCCG